MKQTLPIRNGHFLDVYVKRDKFKSYIKQVTEIDRKYADNFKTYLGCSLDPSKKYIIIKFVLRGFEEI